MRGVCDSVLGQVCLSVILSLALSACSAPPSTSPSDPESTSSSVDTRPLPTHTTPVALYDTASATPGSSMPSLDELPPGRLVYRGGLHLSHEDPRFGGLSAIHLDTTGSRFLAVSDRAVWVQGDLEWTAGRLTGAQVTHLSPLLSPDGTPYEGEARDSEALADLRDGLFAVSFERQHRIALYTLGADWSRTGIPARPHPPPPGSDQYENNGGMEGLTRLPHGRLLAGVERAVNGERQLALLDNTQWRDVRMSAEPGYGLTALATHRDHVYALERFWRRDVGNRIRILRFPTAALDGAGVIEPERLGELEAGMAVDNFEGLAILERDGETLLILVSDDNFSANQRTLMLAFALTL